MSLNLPHNYRSNENLIHTQKQIKYIKDTFEQLLAQKLNLTRVSAPLFVLTHSGLNDDLNGIETAVSFESQDNQFQIVHSLAKWKRFALKQYNFPLHTGLYTDMNALRINEKLDNTHSIYVDQWDWEKVISPEDRTISFLEETVSLIYSALYELDKSLNQTPLLPETIHFITTQELLDMYPTLPAKEREREIVKKHKAVFLKQIGKKLSNDQKHDNRAPDYDDWELNGDILVYNPVLDDCLELSSMGIRVNPTSLSSQLAKENATDRLKLPFHTALMNNQYPLTIGGGIGQSRLCMFFLQKAHIGEVQASFWPDEMKEICYQEGIELL